MKISFIGSGNVASQLANYLSKSHQIVQIYSRNFDNAISLANKVGAEAVASIALLKEVDLLIIAVNDDQIESVAQSILLKDTCIVHTSGTQAIALLSSHKNYGLLYPLQTFTKERLADFSNIPVFIEANTTDTLDFLASFVRQNFKTVHQITFEQRQKLHVAAVIVNNFVNHLLVKADEFLNDSGLEMNYLMPLIQETVAKLYGFSPKEAQTGPAIRKDEQTIQKHLDLIEDDQLKEIYQILTQSIQSTL